MNVKSWNFALIFYPTLACMMLWVFQDPAPRGLLCVAFANTLVMLALVCAETFRLRARVEQLEQRARSEQSGT